MIYLIGSLRDPRVPEVAADLRATGLHVFDDWHAGGPKADDHWRDYERTRGRDYRAALESPFAQSALGLDRTHLDLCTIGVIVAPAGKSAMLEGGYLTGQGKLVYMLFDGAPELDRWDLMPGLFRGGICYSTAELIDRLGS